MKTYIATLAYQAPIEDIEIIDIGDYIQYDLHELNGGAGIELVITPYE